MRPRRLTRITSVPMIIRDTHRAMIMSPKLIPPNDSCFIRGRTLLLTTSLLASTRIPGKISARPNTYIDKIHNTKIPKMWMSLAIFIVIMIYWPILFLEKCKKKDSEISEKYHIPAPPRCTYIQIGLIGRLLFYTSRSRIFRSCGAVIQYWAAKFRPTAFEQRSRDLQSY